METEKKETFFQSIGKLHEYVFTNTHQCMGHYNEHVKCKNYALCRGKTSEPLLETLHGKQNGDFIFCVVFLVA